MKLIKHPESFLEAFKNHMFVCDSISRGPIRKGLHVLWYKTAVRTDLTRRDPFQNESTAVRDRKGRNQFDIPN